MKQNLSDLLQHEIKDLYSAETQLISALPKMAEAASNQDLKNAFRDHLVQTRQHQTRLEEVAKILGFSPSGKTCEAMKGLIKEGEQMIKADADDEVKDAGLIASAQRVEHYEISGYGTVCRFAQMLGKKEALELLKKTLSEEKAADEKLGDLAEKKINEEAMS